MTIAIPSDILQQARLIAARRNLSLSSLVTALLAEMVENDNCYEQAKRRSLARLAAAPALRGESSRPRDSLHHR
ncbi:MAG: hypothetical protein KDE28_28245 [Anaerolineales bacterium]|nr:hypothetical protein [Anaerolineales bacterium]